MRPCFLSPFPVLTLKKWVFAGFLAFSLYARATSFQAEAGGGDWHAVLGVSPEASLEEINQAYRKLYRQFHPGEGFVVLSREITDYFLEKDLIRRRIQPVRIISPEPKLQKTPEGRYQPVLHTPQELKLLSIEQAYNALNPHQLPESMRQKNITSLYIYPSGAIQAALINRLKAYEHQMDYYQILGLTADTPVEEIKDRQKLFQSRLPLHPFVEKDLWHTLSGTEHFHKLGKVFALLLEAVNVLSHPERRVHYDQFKSPSPYRAFINNQLFNRESEALLHAKEHSSPLEARLAYKTQGFNFDFYQNHIPLLKDYYRILEVPQGISQQELKAAYTKIQQEKRGSYSSDRMAEMAEAYRVLSHPIHRAFYDQFGQLVKKPYVFSEQTVHQFFYGEMPPPGKAQKPASPRPLPPHTGQVRFRGKTLSHPLTGRPLKLPFNPLLTEEAYLKKLSGYHQLAEGLKMHSQNMKGVKNTSRHLSRETFRFMFVSGVITFYMGFQDYLSGDRKDPLWFDTFIDSITNPVQLLGLVAFLSATGATGKLLLPRSGPRIIRRLAEINKKFVRQGTLYRVDMGRLHQFFPLPKGTALTSLPPFEEFMAKNKSYLNYRMRAGWTASGLSAISNASLAAGLMASDVAHQLIHTYLSRKDNTYYQDCFNTTLPSQDKHLACESFYREFMVAFEHFPHTLTNIVLAGFLNQKLWNVVGRGAIRFAPNLWKALASTTYGKVIMTTSHLASFLGLSMALEDTVNDFPFLKALEASHLLSPLKAQNLHFHRLNGNQDLHPLQCDEAGENCKYHPSIQNMSEVAFRFTQWRQGLRSRLMKNVVMPNLQWNSFVSEIESAFQTHKQIYKNIFLSLSSQGQTNPFLSDTVGFGPDYQNLCKNQPAPNDLSIKNQVEKEAGGFWRAEKEFALILNELIQETDRHGPQAQTPPPFDVVQLTPGSFIDTNKTRGLTDPQILLLLKELFSLTILNPDTLRRPDLERFFPNFDEAFLWALHQQSLMSGLKKTSSYQILQKRVLTAGVELLRQTVQAKMTVAQNRFMGFRHSSKQPVSTGGDLRTTADFETAVRHLGRDNIFIRLLKHTAIGLVEVEVPSQKEALDFTFNPDDLEEDITRPPTTKLVCVPYRGKDHQSGFLIHPQSAGLSYRKTLKSESTARLKVEKEIMGTDPEWTKNITHLSGYATEGVSDYATVSALCGEELTKNPHHTQTLEKIHRIKKGYSTLDQEFPGKMSTELGHLPLFKGREGGKYQFLPPQILNLNPHQVDLQKLCHRPQAKTWWQRLNSQLTRPPAGMDGKAWAAAVYPSAKEGQVKNSNNLTSLVSVLFHALYTTEYKNPQVREQEFESWWKTQVEPYKELFIMLGDREYGNMREGWMIEELFKNHRVERSFQLPSESTAWPHDTGRGTDPPPHGIKNCQTREGGKNSFMIDRLFCLSKQVGLFQKKQDLGVTNRPGNTKEYRGYRNWHIWNLQIPEGVFENIYYEAHYWSDIVLNFSDLNRQQAGLKTQILPLIQELNPGSLPSTGKAVVTEEDRVEWISHLIENQKNLKTRWDSLKNQVLGPEGQRARMGRQAFMDSFVHFALNRLTQLHSEAVSYALMGVPIQVQSDHRQTQQEEHQPMTEALVQNEMTYQHIQELQNNIKANASEKEEHQTFIDNFFGE